MYFILILQFFVHLKVRKLQEIAVVYRMHKANSKIIQKSGIDIRGNCTTQDETTS